MIDVAHGAHVVDVHQREHPLPRRDDRAGTLVAGERGQQRSVGAREPHRMPALAAPARCGDLGTGAALEQTAFSLPEKTTSDPVRTASGWAVLRVLERKPFDAAELEKQKGQIAASLRQQKQSELFRAFVVKARDRYEITRDAQAWRRALGQEP